MTHRVVPSSRSGQAPPTMGSFLQALHSSQAVSGATHTYYKYPARFSPDFVREAVRLFTRRGDLIFDPFMGGGTCAVEALAEGRRFLGSDVNQLAHFVSRVKTNILSIRDEGCLLGWASALASSIDLSEREQIDPFWVPYQRNIPWRIRKLFSQAIPTIETLGNQVQREFARCSLLRTAQWALDCKSTIPSKDKIIAKHHEVVIDMLLGHDDFRTRFIGANREQDSINQFRRLLCVDASNIHSYKKAQSFGKPNLVLTSPPYLGVHVLYHRWQVMGRRETSAPYWLANKLDGNAESFYTFAGRKSKSDRYLNKLKLCFNSIKKLIAPKAHVMQLVAFTDADVQLPLYLQTLREVGLEQCDILDNHQDIRSLHRNVPNRKWYAAVTNQTSSSKEFLLIHRLRR